MDGDEIFGGILSSVDEDGISSTRMKIQILGTVIHLIVHHNPNILLLVMLPHLLHLDQLATSSLGRSRSRCCLLRRLSLLQQPSEPSTIRLSSESSHPSTLLLSRLGRMLKPKYMLSVHILIEMDLDTEDLVVSHSHEIPGRIVGLNVVGFIPSTTPEFLRSNQISNLEIKRPPDPTPVHSIIGWLLNLVNIGNLPMHSSIGRYLDTGDATSTSRVGISSHLV
mmetsp:Transcript_19872/g.42777  ORF Transcript_19872/g.42777 Transcript_19872/m.42777 type:complete len:223 (-) Transcript_19872:1350-2018(-)